MDKRGFNEALASSLRAEMARRRMTQADVGEVLGISQTGVSLRFSGATNITAYELFLIASHLEVPIDSLVPSRAVAA